MHFEKVVRGGKCNNDLRLLANPTICTIWPFSVKVCQPLMQRVSWVDGGEGVSVSASKHCIGVHRFGSQYSGLLQGRKSFLQMMGSERFGNFDMEIGRQSKEGYILKIKRNSLCKGKHGGNMTIFSLSFFFPHNHHLEKHLLRS